MIEIRQGEAADAPAIGQRPARGFYERAGFAPDGAPNILTGLGGILELRYSREL